MNTPRDRFIKIGNFNTRYWAEGSQGPPVILVHGLGEHIEFWLANFSVLAEKHRVYAVDLPGHGRTDKFLKASYEISDLAQFVKDFMTALEIEHAHLVGHSLGGAIGTRLSLMHPAAVDKLVLVSSAGLGREVSMMLRIPSIPLLGEMLLSRPSREGAENFAKVIMYDPAVMPEDFFELLYQMSLLPNRQKSFLKVLRASVNLFGQSKSLYSPKHIQGLPSITKPVLVVWGRQDQFVPVAHAEVAAQNLPNVRVQIYDNCGHVPMLELPLSFNELLLEFLGH
jgi:4,5:9,10-diseco-3-hydroxy-5,9,17-trioxoandrosta-1(10),2-diene-4-oate hydrolase